jgi:SRSO17 transposase
MERRFQTRLDELRRDARVPAGLLRGLDSRLHTFLHPFVAALTRAEQRDNAGQYVRGLLSNIEAKTAEAIAYLHDRDRQGLQKFVGQSTWDHRPLLAEWARQVGRELGDAELPGRSGSQHNHRADCPLGSNECSSRSAS